MEVMGMETGSVNDLKTYVEVKSCGVFCLRTEQI